MAKFSIQFCDTDRQCRFCLIGSDACPSKGTGSPSHFWTSSKLEQLGYPSIFQLSNFCLNCQKRWNLAGTRCNFDKWSPTNFFRLLEITKQLLTFKQGYRPAYSSADWLHHNHHSPCPQSIRFPWPKRYHSLTLSHKLYVLCHKSLKDISPRIGYHNKERLGLVYTYSQYDRELMKLDINIGESANQAFWSGSIGPQRRVASMGNDHKTDDIFSVCYTKCFRNKSESVSATKKKFFKRKGFHLENICEMKVFSKRK